MTSFLISNFRLVLNFVCFLLGNSPASEFYMPTFRNTLFYLHGRIGIKDQPINMEQNVPKRRHIKLRRRGITQTKAYNKMTSPCWLETWGTIPLSGVALHSRTTKFS